MEVEYHRIRIVVHQLIRNLMSPQHQLHIQVVLHRMYYLINTKK